MTDTQKQPGFLKQIYGLTNEQETEMKNVKFEYVYGITRNDIDTRSLEKRRSSEHEAFAKLAGAYGFKKILSVSFEASYKYVSSSEKKYFSSTVQSTEIQQNFSSEMDLGSVQPKKGKYVYQPCFSHGNIEIDFRHLIIHEEPLKDIHMNCVLAGSEGVEEDLIYKDCSIQSYLDTHRSYTLSYYDAEGVYMGNNWVLDNPDTPKTGNWHLIPYPKFGNDTYWIQHNSGKLLAWYPGADVGGYSLYGGDPSAMKNIEIGQQSSLWRIHTSGLGEDTYYIRSFMHSDRVLAWLPEHRPFVCGDAILGNPNQKYRAIWKISSLY